MTDGAIRTTPDAPVYSSIVEWAPGMTLARIGPHTLNSPSSEPYDFFSPHGQDEPVFQSDEGFRFLVPEGWIIAAQANVPPGPLDKERLLVQYRRIAGDKQATLEVSLADLAEDADLTTYLSGPSFSASHWQPSGAAESLEAGGRRGSRYRFTARIQGAEPAKEVTVFRRGAQGGRAAALLLLLVQRTAVRARQLLARHGADVRRGRSLPRLLRQLPGGRLPLLLVERAAIRAGQLLAGNRTGVTLCPHQLRLLGLTLPERGSVDDAGDHQRQRQQCG